MMHKILAYLVVLMMMLLMACQSEDWQAIKSFGPEGWAMEDSLVLTPPVNLSAPTLHIGLELDPETYPYRNLWLKLLQREADGSFREQIVSDTLIDEMGHWLREFSGQTVEWEMTVSPTADFSPSGASLSLIQYMRENQLTGVKKIKIRWESAEP